MKKLLFVIGPLIFIMHTPQLPAQLVEKLSFSKTMLNKPSLTLYNFSRQQPGEPNIGFSLRLLPEHQDKRKSDSRKGKMAYIIPAYMVSVGMGIIGAFCMGTMSTNKGCTYLNPYCFASDKSTETGFILGGTIGNILSFKLQTKKSEKDVFFPVFFGSVIGGVGGYLISKETNVLLGILAPPVAALVSLKLAKYKF